MKTTLVLLALMVFSNSATAVCPSSGNGKNGGGGGSPGGGEPGNRPSGFVPSPVIADRAPTAVTEPASGDTSKPTSDSKPTVSDRADVVRDENGGVLGLRQGGSRLREKPVIKEELPPNSLGDSKPFTPPSQPDRPGVDNPGSPGGPDAPGIPGSNAPGGPVPATAPSQ